jgi:hypothetical protein
MRNLQRAVIYGKPRQRECAAVAEGLESLGAAVQWRNHGYFSPGDVLADVDVAVTFGQRLHSAVAAQCYRDAGVPVLTVDLPPIRDTGSDEDQKYRSLWLDRVNWLPTGPCPADRMTEMGIEYPAGRREGGRTVLVCGQTEADAAHGMGAVEIRAWSQSTLDAVGEFYPVLWRPHPKCIFAVDGHSAWSVGQPLEVILRDHWRAVVTFNSTAGLTALRLGIPVFCDPSCFYAELGNVSLAGLSEPRFPTVDEFVGFFSRLTYTQWTFEELANGEALDFVLAEIPAKALEAEVA